MASISTNWKLKKMERKHIKKRIIIKNNVSNNDDDDNNNNNVKRTKLSNNNNNNNNVHNNTSTMTTNDMILNLYLSDWECLQRGLATLRKFRNQLNKQNVITISQYVLNGQFNEADKISKTMTSTSFLPPPDTTTKTKTNIGDVMKEILKQDHNNRGTKLKRINSTLLEIINRKCTNNRHLLLLSFATAIMYHINDKKKNDTNYLNYAKTIIQWIPELYQMYTNSNNNNNGNNIENTLPFMYSPTFLKQLIELQFFPSIKSMNQLETSCHSYRIINAAYNVALRGNQRGAKHGAVLFNKDGHVLSIGWNHRYDVPIKKQGSKVIHAEVHCLIQLTNIQDANGGTVYIIEPNLNDHLTYCNAQPCRQCTIALSKVGICKAIYTSSDGTMKQLNIKQNMNDNVEAGSLKLALRFKSKECGDVTDLLDVVG